MTQGCMIQYQHAVEMVLNHEGLFSRMLMWHTREGDIWCYTLVPHIMMTCTHHDDMQCAD